MYELNLFLSTDSSSSSNKPLLLQACATALSFSLMPSLNPSGEEDEEEEEEERRTDPDVIPTLLAYKDGELEHTWVRVDFEIGSDGRGLEGLLRR